jgi:hypothetical protein
VKTSKADAPPAGIPAYPTRRPAVNHGNPYKIFQACATASHDALPFGRLWYGERNAISNAVDYAKFRSRSHDALIRVCDEAGNVIQTQEHSAFLLILMFFR